MVIKAIKYSRYSKSEREWKIVGKAEDGFIDYVEFSEINLLISRNGAGKSRTLSIIRELSEFINESRKIENASYSCQNFDFIFTHDETIFRYVLKIKDRTVIEEQYYENEKILLDYQREILLSNNDNIFYEEKFRKPLFIFLKRKGKYLFSEIMEWALSLRSLPPRNDIDKKAILPELSILNKNIKKNIDSCYHLQYVFYHTEKEFGREYVNEIIDCLNGLGFSVTNILLRKVKKGYSLSVEEDKKYYTDQEQMSQRLYVALSVFAILIAAKFNKTSMCVLIDDFGEGFDYINVKRIIDLVINKSYRTYIQYFITTNDKAVMNSINLRYWSVIDRVGNKSIFYNIINSKNNFEDYKYTGLNNFDFFCSGFYKYGFGEDDTNDNDDNDNDNDKNSW